MCHINVNSAGKCNATSISRATFTIKCYAIDSSSSNFCRSIDLFRQSIIIITIKRKVCIYCGATCWTRHKCYSTASCRICCGCDGGSGRNHPQCIVVTHGIGASKTRVMVGRCGTTYVTIKIAICTSDTHTIVSSCLIGRNGEGSSKHLRRAVRALSACSSIDNLAVFEGIVLVPVHPNYGAITIYSVVTC